MRGPDFRDFGSAFAGAWAACVDLDLPRSTSVEAAIVSASTTLDARMRRCRAAVTRFESGAAPAGVARTLSPKLWRCGSTELRTGERSINEACASLEPGRRWPILNQSRGGAVPTRMRGLRHRSAVDHSGRRGNRMSFRHAAHQVRYPISMLCPQSTDAIIRGPRIWGFHRDLARMPGFPAVSDRTRGTTSCAPHSTIRNSTGDPAAGVFSGLPALPPWPASPPVLSSRCLRMPMP